MKKGKQTDAVQITFDARNYRKHGKKNKDLIKKSLEELGAGRSVLIDKENSLIAGNGVFEQAQALGIPVRVIETDGKELIAVKRTDLATADEKRKKLALADNAASDLSEWDVPMIQTDWEKEALSDWGVELPEFEDPTETKEAQEDDFDEEKDKVETVCKKGDIWLLGQYRLMCGDSTLPEDVARLMNGEKASMVYTDPPYGMHLDTDYGKYREDNEEYVKKYNLKQTKGNSYKPVAGDNDDFKPELVTTIFDNFDYCKEIFVWGGDYYPELLKGYKDGNYIVWDKKSNEGLDKALDSTNSNNFELCWSKQKHKKDIVRVLWVRFFGTEQEFDHKRYHPTQKPTKLSRWFIDKYSKESDTVVDLYGGSGSTLIACEQLGRKCYMMELDPHYCDVIIARWEKLTGQKAIKIK